MLGRNSVAWGILGYVIVFGGFALFAKGFDWDAQQAEDYYQWLFLGLLAIGAIVLAIHRRRRD